MRTNVKERRSNARQWYFLLMNGRSSKSAVVVKRCVSSTPNINRVQLLACYIMGTQVVIAESVDGLTGCFHELLQNIKKLDTVRTYHEYDFNEWLSENYSMYLTYNDGMVLMFEREEE